MDQKPTLYLIQELRKNNKFDICFCLEDPKQGWKDRVYMSENLFHWQIKGDIEDCVELFENNGYNVIVRARGYDGAWC